MIPPLCLTFRKFQLKFGRFDKEIKLLPLKLAFNKNIIGTLAVLLKFFDVKQSY